MGIASVIIACICLILAIIPAINLIAFIPIVIALGLGIADVVVKSKKQLPKKSGIAGIIISVIAALSAIVVNAIFVAAVNQAMQEL